MRERILNDLKEAMKAQDKEKLAVIRMVKGAIQMQELDKKSELTDDEVIGVIAKEIKTRKESIVEFEKGNRKDLIEKTEAEIDILDKYMPEQLSEEEVSKIIDEAFDALKPTASDMGKVMGYITPKVKGKADLSSISRIVKERISNL
ncbi:MAG: GatB/YqeY domain-containing protein [Bacilli bacterium]|nr:GatB/YqeY domain-containing protein [Bacilli bacterium]